MKLISFFLCFCLSFNVLAASGTIQSLEKELDEYQYALSVDWDQQDQAFYEQRTQDFFNALSTLMAQGLTQEEVIAMAEKKISSKETVEALKLKLGLLSKGVATTEELAQILKENSKGLYQHGASWNGEVMGYVGIGLLVAALIGYAIWFEINYKCVQYDYRYSCSTSTSGNRTTTNCGNKRYCAHYEKR